MFKTTPKKNLAISGIIASLFLLTACKEDTTKTNNDLPKLTIGTSADNPPFEFLQEGKIVGFDIELMEEVAKELKMQLDIKDMNFDGILGSLASGRIDAAIACISPSEERKKAVDFTDEYYHSTKSLVCLEGTSVKVENDLKDQTIGVQAGSVHELYANGDLKEKVASLQVKSLPRVPDLIQDLKTKRITCIMIGTKEAEALVSENPGLTSITLENTASGIAIALPKGSALTEKINAVLVTLKKNGVMDKLQNQWLKD